MLSPDTPVVLLQHHGLDNLGGKTGLALLRYRRGPVVAVIDPDHAGEDLERLTGINRGRLSMYERGIPVRDEDMALIVKALTEPAA